MPINHPKATTAATFQPRPLKFLARRVVAFTVIDTRVGVITLMPGDYLVETTDGPIGFSRVDFENWFTSASCDASQLMSADASDLREGLLPPGWASKLGAAMPRQTFVHRPNKEPDEGPAPRSAA